MLTRQPKFSVIIPVRPGGDFKPVFRALKAADYPHELIEVFISYGFSPSRQRNKAAKRARGEILYFLDNDSEISIRSFQRCVEAFKSKRLGGPAPIRVFSLLPIPVCRMIEKKFFSGRVPRGKVAVVGGPSIWTRKESFWPSVAGIVFESFFAYFTMTSRFRPTGDFRYTNERELILCNLAVKRKVFNGLKGFREELFPNEENEFLSRVYEKGFDLIYHPGIFVQRPRRESLSQMLKMFFRYGRGRMEHMRIRRINGLKEGKLYLMPLILLLYLLELPFFHSWFAVLPITVYFGMGFGSALGFAARRKKKYLSIILPGVFLAVHLSYAAGILAGMFSSLKKRRKAQEGTEGEVKVVKIKNFDAPFLA